MAGTTCSTPAFRATTTTSGSPSSRRGWTSDDLLVDLDEIQAWTKEHPQPFDRDAYQGAFQDPHGDPAEPHVGLIRRLANEGLDYLGHHGPVVSMGVERNLLPKWDDIQFVTAQLARKPQLDHVEVGTEVIVGPNAAKPLRLDIPMFVSDMSFGALSEEAKVALARGAEMAGTGICSGEGGMLPEEKAESSRYFYELASGKFGWSLDKVAGCTSLSLQTRPGGQNRNRWTSAGHQSPRQDRRGAGPGARHRRHFSVHVCRVRLRRRLPTIRRSGQRGLRRGADRGEDVGSTHRGRHRRGTADRS